MTVVRAMTFVIVTLAASSVGSAAERVADDLAGLQGTWSASAGAKKKISLTLEIHGRDVTVVIKPPVGATIRATGEIRVDATTAPKTLDWVRFTGLDGQTLPEILGIYELTGDTFRVCTGGPDNPRPTAFEPGEGMLADVLTFTRQAATAPSADRQSAE